MAVTTMIRTLFVVVVASMVASALGGRGYFGIGESSSSEDSSAYKDGAFRGSCACPRNYNISRKTFSTPNPCANNTGANNICGKSATSYLTCNDKICSIANCSADQLWNTTLKACVSCKTGYHIATNYPRCICNEGTTLNRSSHSCVACPTNSVQLKDECFCNTTGTYRFLSLSPFACKACPGAYVTTNITLGNPRRPQYVQYQVCQCSGANDIFNKRSVSCVTCPSGATAVKSNFPNGDDVCKCPPPRKFYNATANACACAWGLVLNSSGTACERASRVPLTTTTKASP